MLQVRESSHTLARVRAVHCADLVPAARNLTAGLYEVARAERTRKEGAAAPISRLVHIPAPVSSKHLNKRMAL